MSARPVSVEDLRFMDAALALAYGRLGATAPNPSVGCVIVKQGRIIGAAATAAGGRPHAEPQALAQAGAAARDARVYVSLEPCAHYGQTPPCAEALIKARPAEVVIACRDPFESVAGRGVALLKQAGIGVLEGVREAQALALNAGFFHRLKTGRPLLGRDRRAGLYDADLILEPGESLDEALERLGADGLTRIRQVE